MAAQKLTKSYLHVPNKRPFMGVTVGQQLYQVAEKYSDKEMYVFYVDKERITFKQMKEKSQYFAASLFAKGFKRGDTIAVWGANHAEWLVAWYATMQLGMLLVPLRLEFSNEMVGAALKKFMFYNNIGLLLMKTCVSCRKFKNKCKGLLLTRSPSNIWSRTCEIFPELKESSDDVRLNSERYPDMEFFIVNGTVPDHITSQRYVYSFDEFMTLGGESDIDNVKEICMSLDMDEACCIFFTSGSTGMPKGTVHSSHAILNNMRMYTELDNIDFDLESCRFGHAITFSGAAALLGILEPLVHGSTTIVLFPEFSAVTMAKAFQDERVSASVFLIHHIHDLLNVPDITEYDLSHLDLMFIGGSVIPSEMRRNLRKLCKYVITLFGMTEVHILYSTHPDDPKEKQQCAAMRPISGSESRVVDDKGLTVAVNTMGELNVRTYSTFLYYMDEPEKTMEMKDKTGWVHTGDLAIMDEDGYIQIQGRKKELIIKQGLNLAPAELEKRLYQHPHINTAVVIGVPDPRVGEEICACLRVDRENQPTTEEIRTFCNGQFSRPMLTELAKDRLDINEG